MSPADFSFGWCKTKKNNYRNSRCAWRAWRGLLRSTSFRRNFSGISEVLGQTLKIEMWRRSQWAGWHHHPFWKKCNCIFMCSVYLWLVVSWPKPMGFSNINHYHGSLIFERVGQLIWPWTTYYCTGSKLQTCFHALLQKHPEEMVGWLVDATFCHMLFGEFGWTWVWDELSWFFLLESCKNAAVVSLAFSIKPTSSAKIRLRVCLFPFHAEKFSICVPRWIQIHLSPNRLGLWSPSDCFILPPGHTRTPPGWIWPSPGQAGRWLDENGRREIPEVWCSQGDEKRRWKVSSFFGLANLCGRWNC